MTVGDAGAFNQRDARTELKMELHQRLLELINLSALDTMSREQIEAETGDIIHEELAKQNHALNQVERKQLVADVLDELLGLGPLEPLLKDPTITDILVNGYNQVFVERYGVLEATPVRFKDEKHLVRIIQKIVSAVGRRIDESSPMVDARLADGSRVNAVVPPLAIDGSLLSIRKFARVPISLERLIEIGSVPAQVAEVMKAVVGSRRNVFISLASDGRGEEYRCSTPCRRSSTAANASSPSRTLPSFSFSRNMSSGWKRGRRTSKARARSPSATS